MARARRVISDVNSVEVDELRRMFNTLLVVLENISEQVDAATITATEGFVALGLTLSTGTDSTVASINGGANTYTGTGRSLNGVKPTPLHPKQVRSAETIPMESSDDF